MVTVILRTAHDSANRNQRLYSFAIGEKHNLMALLEVKVLDLDDFFVRPVNRWALIYFTVSRSAAGLYSPPGEIRVGGLSEFGMTQTVPLFV